ncbi:protein BIG GRAIN 1-like B [Cicer arietinum]|uniref:Protein BIG GRAIN 1-like B n=1 Tax=Cicer arietinum TaxID=3827 RepID=A0A1S2YAH7_CICAR|nr:protein BIG GRAIN 1-like B [Cicer arietinum]
MYKLEKTRREQRFHNYTENPSFSSTLLDKIYRSIDEGETKGSDINLYTETTIQKQTKTNSKCNRPIEEKPNLLRTWKGSQNIATQVETKMFHHNHQIHEHDVLFFSSTSSSSDSSSGLLSSSSDTESLYKMKSRVSCFAPSRPKNVKTSLPREKFIANDEDGLIKSKSRALKIYNNLKKVKQPISPGGKLTNFINNLFTTSNNNTKKTKTVNTERNQASTCSSASSFSRSCLSKTSTTSKDKLRNSVKRTVRFYPVSVIIDEDNRNYGQKEVVTKKKEEEQVGRELLREYKILRDFLPMRKNEGDDDEDDVASCSSSDLFELDHLMVMGNDNRYCEDLPVFETTRVSTNRAIANGRIM